MILSASALGTGSLPLGLTTASKEEANLPLLWGCSTCSACGATANGFCSIESGRWRCVICGQLTALESDKTREFGFSAFELSSDSPNQVDNSKTNFSIIVVDENLPSSDMIKLRDSLNESLSTLPDDFYLSLIFFGRAVKIVELGTIGDRISSEAFSGTQSPSNDDVRELARHESAVSGSESFVAPLHVARGTVFRALTFYADHVKTWSVNSTTQPRCFGPAVEYALQLAKVCDASSASIIILTGGPPTVGPGSWPNFPEITSADARGMVEQHRAMSASYFAELGILALSSNCTADIFCYGNGIEYGLTAYKEMTKNVFFRAVDCSLTLSMALQEDSNRSRIIDIKISDQKKLVPVHVCGSDAGGSILSFSTHGAATVFLEDKSKSSSQGDVFIQTRSRQVRGGGKEIVATYRLSHSRPFTVMDGEALAVVVAKRSCIIMESSQGDATLAKKHVENEIYNAAKLVRDGVMDSTQFDSFSRTLFHFHRGRLLEGAGSQYSIEESEALRSFFLFLCDNAHSSLMMSPALVAFRWQRVGAATSPPRPVSLSTMSLQSDCCLVLDQLTEVLVWFGSDVPLNAKERKEAIAHAKAISSSLGRYPVAKMKIFEEASPKARWLRSILSPEHKDLSLRAAEQETRKLLTKLGSLPRDDLSYSEFLRVCLGASIGLVLDTQQQQQRVMTNV